MNRATFRLVLLVSCAHAMVHVYELSFPSVEQQVGAEFHVGKDTTGEMGTAWRLPFGFGALLAGWITDRLGCKRMLIVYLLGCVGTSLAAWWAPDVAALFVTLFAMGCFASIYHPAGLSIISREAPAAVRSAALGWHGIFGSLGIATAPLIAAIMLSLNLSWRDYYLVLMAPGVVLALAISILLRESSNVGCIPMHRGPAIKRCIGMHPTGLADDEPTEPMHWGAFLNLVAIGVLTGFIYAALMQFMARYLSGSGSPQSSSLGQIDVAVRFVVRTLTGSDQAVTPAITSKYGAMLVLVCGAFGQGFAGKLATPARLRPLMALIVAAQVPCLAWMAVAEGPLRLWAAAVTGLVHFMSQPVYNSLIALFVPHHRRSLGYGFSNMVCFGLGAFGPTVAGQTSSDFDSYMILAGIALVATALALLLCRQRAK